MMKGVLFVLIATLVCALSAPPQRYPLSKYRLMWEKSLVTVKPPPPEAEEADETTALDDYSLGGWTKTNGGYFVTLINQKNPRERVILSPGLPTPSTLPPIKILSIDEDPTDFMSAKVNLDVGGKKKTIGFDEQVLTLKNAAPTRSPNGQNNRNRTQNQSQNQRRPNTPNTAQQNRGQQNQRQRPANNATRPNQPPIPTTTNQNSSSSNSGNSTRRQPRVRRVPTPPR